MAFFKKVPQADSPALHKLIEDFAVLTFESQPELGSIAALADWEVDLNTCSIRFDDNTFDVQVLGSLQNGTWQWAWKDRGFAKRPDHPAISGVNELRGRADELQVPEFAAPSVKVDGLDDLGFIEGAGMASVATQLIGMNAFFGAPSGRATMFFALNIPLPEPTMESLNQNVQYASQHTARIEDSIRAWAEKRGASINEIDGGIKVTLPDGKVCEFFTH